MWLFECTATTTVHVCTATLLLYYFYCTLSVFYKSYMCAHLLPSSVALTMPNASCAASCFLLLGLYCNLWINSPPDVLLHLELRIYTVVAEFALLDWAIKIKQLRTEWCFDFRLNKINKIKKKKRHACDSSHSAWLLLIAVSKEKKKNSHACDSSRSA